MKKIILIQIFTVFLFNPYSFAFFFGFGGAGGMDVVVKEGMKQGVIPATVAPSNLKAVMVSPIKINLTWQDNSNDELGFEIERKVADGSYGKINTVGVNITLCTDVNFNTGVIYYYRVRAYNANGNSDYSNEAKILPSVSNLPAIPSVPSGPNSGTIGLTYTYSVSATDPDANKIRYGWDWGDGSPIEWSVLGASGWTDNRIHSWANPGIYNIEVKTQNIYGAESGWSSPKTMTICVWRRVSLGSGGNQMGDVAVGNGRNDGTVRVYGADYDNHIYEFTWVDTSSSWIKTDMGAGGADIEGITVGNGRNDGLTRVYGGSWDRSVYEYTGNYSSWTIVDIGSGGNKMNNVVVGNGRNDGVVRVYGASDDDYLYEFTWQ